MEFFVRVEQKCSDSNQEHSLNKLVLYREGVVRGL